MGLNRRKIMIINGIYYTPEEVEDLLARGFEN